MDNLQVKKVFFLALFALFLLGGLFAYDYLRFQDGKLHIVFCDVGQGDAILIKTPNKKIIMVDGGPDKKVLTCLSNHLPFWHRKIDLFILTHPHLDHFFGIHYLLERYSVTAFATEELSNDTDSFEDLMRKLEEKNIPQRKVFANDRFRIGEVIIKIESPTIANLHAVNANGDIDDMEENTSVITRLTFGEFSALLTGDSPEDGLFKAGEGEGPVDVFKVPHHGSKTGMSNEVLELYQPQLAVITVGKKNRYGHPAKKTLEMLRDYKVPIMRTDESGDVEIISDGEKFWLSGKN